MFITTLLGLLTLQYVDSYLMLNPLITVGITLTVTMGWYKKLSSESDHELIQQKIDE